MQHSFTFPTIPVTVISNSPNFENARMNIDFNAL